MERKNGGLKLAQLFRPNSHRSTEQQRRVVTHGSTLQSVPLKMDDAGFPLSADGPENVFRAVAEAEVSLDEMLSLACRQGKQDIVELLLESGANVNHRNKAGNTPLLEACSQGHVSIARLLLDRTANIDAPTEMTYDSALTWACTLGNVEIVHLLLERRSSVEHRTKDGCTALMFAALAGHEKVAELLLDHKAEINVESDSNKDSPLTFACWKGHQKVVELFLERRADIEHRTKEGFSPLMFAALGGHTRVAELLLRHKAEVNHPSGSNSDIPLTSACWKGHHQVVYLLLQHHSDIEHRTKDGCTPLMLAAREGHLTVAELLLEHRAMVNMPSGSESNIPLTLACWKGHRDVVELLLQRSSCIEHQNKAGCTPLMLAAREGHFDATQLLLDSGAKINVPSGSNDDTPLTLACWKGHEDVVQLLIERSSNVNHQTKTGCTPLMEATREGHVGVAKLLLEAGADVETPDNYGQSPFFMACWKGHAEVAALLLEYDANKDCRTKTGITPLFQACRENHIDVVKLLLDYGCNPSSPFPNSRECPLTLAAEKGYSELAQLLLSRSAAVDARTKKGCSPLFLACREGFRDIAIMLAKHGASTEAVDQRGTSPLLACFKSGHVEVVEWLLAHVAHLPSDGDCHKALSAPTEADIQTQRNKCLELIMKAKKAREQAALKNAQILFEELDAEREQKEHKKMAAAKRRDRRKEKKMKQLAKKTTATTITTTEPARLVSEDEEEGEGGKNTTSDRLSPLPLDRDDVSIPPKKKKSSKKRKKANTGETPPIATPTTQPYVDSSDSEAEYHDAWSDLPGEITDFTPAEPISTVRESQPVATKDYHNPPRVNNNNRSSTTSEANRSSASQKWKPSSHPPPPAASLLSRDAAATGLRGTGVCEKNPPPPTYSSSHATEGRAMACSKEGGEKRKPPLGKAAVRKVHASAAAAPAAVEDGSRSSTKNVKNRLAKAEKIASTGLVDHPALSPSSSGRKTESSTTADVGGKGTEPLATHHTPSKLRGQGPVPKPASKSIPDPKSKKDPQKDGSESGWSNPAPPTSSSSNKSHDLFSSISPIPPASHVTQPTNHAKAQSSFSSAKLRQQSAWNGATEPEWTEDSSCWSISDDDKIRAAQAGTPVSIATSAFPTPTSSTVVQSWHEVTRTTRTVQLTVSNALVGRIIGRAGAKINNIQEVSGAHINVSRNIPKSTERLVTIKGTQRSITKAHEMIEVALSMPDREPTDVLPPSPSPDGSKVFTRSLSPLPSFSSSPSSSVPLSKPRKKCSDAPASLPGNVPPNLKPAPLLQQTSGSASLPLQATPAGTTSSPRHQPPTSTHHPPSISSTPGDASTQYLPTSAPSSSTGLVVERRSSSSDSSPSPSLSSTTSESSSSQRVLTIDPLRSITTAWTRVSEGGSTFAEVTAASMQSGTRGDSPALEERSAPSHAAAPSVTGSEDMSVEDGGVKASPLTRPAIVSVTPEPDLSSSMADFPPLRKHSRSKSDPQLSSEQAQSSGEKKEPPHSGSMVMQSLPGSSQFPHHHPAHSLSPSRLPAIESQSEEAQTLSGMSVGESEKLSIESKRSNEAHSLSPRRELVAEEAEGSGMLSPASAASPSHSTSPVAKPTKSAAIVQPTQQQQQQQQHRISLPARSPLPTSTTLTDPPSSPLSSRPFTYGAIGPPPSAASRRSSMPSGSSSHMAGGGRQRKVGSAGMAWGAAVGGAQQARTMTFLPEHGEMDSFTPSPPSSTTGPVSMFPGVADGERGRSFSWAGQHQLLAGGVATPPFAPQGLQHMVYVPKPSPSSSSSMDDPHHPPPPPISPSTLHGERLYSANHEFARGGGGGGGGGTYGAIGSHVVTTTTTGAAIPPSRAQPPFHSTSFPGVAGFEPFQPHPPPVAMHPVASGNAAWGGGGHHHHHPHGIPPAHVNASVHLHHQQHQFPQHFVSSTGRPYGPAHQAPPHPQHILQRAMGQKLGVHPPPPQGALNFEPPQFRPTMRSGSGPLEEDHAPIAPPPPHHKRWSVPSFPHQQHPPLPNPPAFPGSIVQSHPSSSSSSSSQLPPSETQSWSSSGYTTSRPSSMMEGGSSNSSSSDFQAMPHHTHSLPTSSLSALSDPWGTGFSNSLGGTQAIVCTTSSSSASRQTDPKLQSPSKGRSLSVCMPSPSSVASDVWSSSSSPDKPPADSGLELQKLIKSLDINSEHLHSLKARKLSLQQLHTMSDEEWRSLKLPVGPRVKLMNAISSMPKPGSKLQPSHEGGGVVSEDVAMPTEHSEFLQSGFQ